MRSHRRPPRPRPPPREPRPPRDPLLPRDPPRDRDPLLRRDLLRPREMPLILLELLTVRVLRTLVVRPAVERTRGALTLGARTVGVRTRRVRVRVVRTVGVRTRGVRVRVVRTVGARFTVERDVREVPKVRLMVRTPVVGLRRVRTDRVRTVRLGVVTPRKPGKPDVLRNVLPLVRRTPVPSERERVDRPTPRREPRTPRVRPTLGRAVAPRLSLAPTVRLVLGERNVRFR